MLYDTEYLAYKKAKNRKLKLRAIIEPIVIFVIIVAIFGWMGERDRMVELQEKARVK